MIWILQHSDKLCAQLKTMGEQSQRQAELYDAAIKRARHSETDAHTAISRAKQLEADLTAAEAARETFACDSAKVSTK